MVLITLVLMKRGSNNTVTHLPILIPTNQRDAEGFAAFQDEVKGIRPVRALRTDDLTDLRKAMAADEAKHFSAITMLSRALGKNPDLLAIKKAEELLSEAYSLKIKSDESAGRSFPPFPEPENPEEERMDFARALTRLLAIPVEKTAAALRGRKTNTDPRWLLSYEISRILRDAKFVLWWNGESFQPAIWCSEMKIAFYAYALMGMFHICPHCGKPFSPSRPDQTYCLVSHREAHRVARWRTKQKTRHKKGRG